MFTTALLSVAVLTGCTFSTPNFHELEQQGESFARNSVTEIAVHWDGKVLMAKADPSLSAAGDPAALMAVFASNLGPLKKIVAINRKDYNAAAGILINRPDYVGLYTCDIDCQRGPATVAISVMHKDNRWSVNGFHVDAKVFKDLNKSDRAESQAYVESVAPKLCRHLDVANLKQYASTDLAVEIGNGLQAAAADASFGAVQKLLGQYKNCSKIRSRDFTLLKGKYVYHYIAEAEYTNTKAVASISVVKENGQWRLRAFNIHTNSQMPRSRAN